MSRLYDFIKRLGKIRAMRHGWSQDDYKMATDDCLRSDDPQPVLDHDASGWRWAKPGRLYYGRPISSE